MARTCLFCLQKATTKEHALPAWVAKQLGLRGTFLEFVFAVGPGVEPSKQPISVASHRKKILCAQCQTHFKHLEDRAMPLLLPMARGENKTYDLGDQHVLAEWGAKTAYCLIAVETGLEKTVPEVHRFYLRTHGAPPGAAWVAYGNYGGSITKHAGTIDLESLANRPPRSAYNAVMTFGQVALKVFGVIEPASQHSFGMPVGVLEQVWPQRSTQIRWPLPTVIDDVTFADLMLYVPLLK